MLPMLDFPGVAGRARPRLQRHGHIHVLPGANIPSGECRELVVYGQCFEPNGLGFHITAGIHIVLEKTAEGYRRAARIRHYRRRL